MKDCEEGEQGEMCGGGREGREEERRGDGEGAHVLLAAAIMISCGHQDGTCQAVSLSRQGQRALLPRL